MNEVKMQVIKDVTMYILFNYLETSYIPNLMVLSKEDEAR